MGRMRQQMTRGKMAAVLDQVLASPRRTAKLIFDGDAVAEFTRFSRLVLLGRVVQLPPPIYRLMGDIMAGRARLKDQRIWLVTLGYDFNKDTFLDEFYEALDEIQPIGVYSEAVS